MLVAGRRRLQPSLRALVPADWGWEAQRIPEQSRRPPHILVCMPVRIRLCACTPISTHTAILHVHCARVCANVVDCGLIVRLPPPLRLPRLHRTGVAGVEWLVIAPFCETVPVSAYAFSALHLLGYEFGGTLDSNSSCSFTARYCAGGIAL